MKYLFFVFLLSLLQLSIFAGEVQQSEKEYNLASLEKRVSAAKEKINESSKTKAGDFLKLLPNVSFTRSAPTGKIQDKETYISISFSANQFGNISDKRNSRDEEQKRGIRRLESISFEGRKLIERKSLISERIWKMTQIRKSLSNPVEVTALDEKIDEMTVRLQETEIDIEKLFAEIEYLVAGVER